MLTPFEIVLITMAAITVTVGSLLFCVLNRENISNLIFRDHNHIRREIESSVEVV
jgi:hypothetical protein